MASQSAYVLTLLIVVVELFLGITAPDPIPIEQCTKINACACVYDDGAIVNLEGLDRKDGKPNFSNTTNIDETEYYSWNPCTPFSYDVLNDTECQNVAVCMIRKGIPKELFYDLGNHNTAEFMVDSNGTLKLTYTSVQGDYKRVAEISLICMATSIFDFFVAEGEQQETNNTIIYKLLLASKYSCAYAPNLNPSETVSSLNAGEIFVARITAPDPIPIGQCTKINACSCVYDDGTIVNLEGLDRKDGKPNFSNTTNTDKSEYYSWNPCTPFTYDVVNDTECQNVAVCMIRKGIPKELFYDLGNQDTAEFMVDSNGTLKLTYTSDQGDYKRVAEISLQCMASSKFDFFVAEGEQQETNNTIIYKLLLASKYSCAYAPNLNPSETVSSLNAGEIFAIVLFSLIGAYVVLGIMYQAFVKKESGKRLCPNHEFWCNLPDKFKGDYRKVPLSTESGAKYDAIE